MCIVGKLTRDGTRVTSGCSIAVCVLLVFNTCSFMYSAFGSGLQPGMAPLPAGDTSPPVALPEEPEPSDPSRALKPLPAPPPDIEPGPAPLLPPAVLPRSTWGATRGALGEMEALNTATTSEAERLVPKRATEASWPWKLQEERECD